MKNIKELQALLDSIRTAVSGKTFSESNDSAELFKNIESVKAQINYLENKGEV